MNSATARRPRLVFLSSVATPQQVKFCTALQDYFDATFWFYEHPDRTRGAWWRVDLGAHCEVLSRVLFAKTGPLAERYLPLGLEERLRILDPDIVMVGGFSIPGNWLAYRWAIRNGKRAVVFTERSRDASGALRKNNVVWKLQRWLYRDVHQVIVSADDAVEQFRDEFQFGDKVVAGRYASDLDDYFRHPERKARSAYTYLFANRMTEIYNPLGAIDIFAAIRSRHPGSRLLMNAAGELGGICRERIAALALTEDVDFLDGLKSWSDLNDVYARSDVLLLPAHFSNGNFTILEAMASGMGLVISNRILGIGKMVEDGHNGFNCEPTTDQFVDRVERYIADPALFRKHAQINRALVAPLGAKGTAARFDEILNRDVPCK
ncbi:glycosyltransferase [Ideonella sp. DXS22W]|uniref:Glycosyltransferase n=1 Tax=Pseudaquabacterium inlustre TaxID=2984192 RepID=A0ABU9CH48_9BURK